MAIPDPTQARTVTRLGLPPDAVADLAAASSADLPVQTDAERPQKETKSTGVVLCGDKGTRSCAIIPVGIQTPVGAGQKGPDYKYQVGLSVS